MRLGFHPSPMGARRRYSAPGVAELSDPEKAYIAGIVEGEGHIGIRWEPPDPRSRNVSPRIRSILEIEMTDEDIILWLSEKLGGRPVNRRKRNPKHRTTWRLPIPAAHLAPFLAQIMPWMRSWRKRREAELVYELAKISRAGLRGHGRVTPQPILERRMVLFEEMRRLHQPDPLVLEAL